MGGAQRAEVERAYRAYGHSVLRRAQRMLGSRQEACEVVQDVFVCLLDATVEFRGQSSISTYLYAITTNMCLNRLRDGRNRERLLALHPEVSDRRLPPPWPDTFAALRQILGRLPDDEARAAVYYYLDGMSHREVAGMLGCSRRHVGDLLTRLRLRVERSQQEVAR
jgi:RNA polymerase sigma factor (sigma-70 family)